ncbi:MAG: [protein-PII] uridylyltransferase [Cocleimonas sp.]
MHSNQLYKENLKSDNLDLQKQFEKGESISSLLCQRSQQIDTVLQQMWTECFAQTNTVSSLIAVGGYGREEMHPQSDVDLLILLAKDPEADDEQKLSDFVTQLWDLGLEIGHSVRTISECFSEAENDLSIITNLIESRYLAGDIKLFDQLKTQVSNNKLWSSKDFFKAKVTEQKKRYKRFGDTAYRVEPNLKEGPGGLRDLQTIGWIVIREYGIHSLKTLSESEEHDLLNPEEYKSLIEARNFLWQVRFVLHQLTGRKEDRLLFDHQRHLAHSFGYTNDENNASIETFMQRYYRTITQLERLNEILLGLLREHILESATKEIRVISQFYHSQDNYLGLIDKDILLSHPHTFLEIFIILQMIPELKGLTPQTIRELRRNIHIIDDAFRNHVHIKQQFICILSESKRVNFVLRRMNRYGILAAYIPAFANIVGRMQYDLFHAYTVDEHTLNVVRNIRVLSTQKGKKELPFCSDLFQKIEKPMLLVLAGIFHDIAKGRGGSHSELGAVDAQEFCFEHDLSLDEIELVSWLVAQHLQLSTTAQRKDINDPEVIGQFSQLVKTQERLDYLYLLTICDIKGTNPTLLNSWKHSLLKDLYLNTSKALQDTDNKSNLELIKQDIDEKKKEVIALLAQTLFDQSSCETFWNRFDDDYILQYQSNLLARHIKEVGEQIESNNIVYIDKSENGESTELFIYTKDTQGLFIRITSAIEQFQLNTVAANITSSKDGYDLYTFYLLTHDGIPLEDEHDIKKLLDKVNNNLQQESLSYNFDHHRMPRQLKHFDTPTLVQFNQDEVREQTIITIKTADSAGLLTRIGEVFNQCSVVIHNARIATLGELAEDIFHITHQSGKAILEEDDQQQIRQALVEKLEALNL